MHFGIGAVLVSFLTLLVSCDPKEPEPHEHALHDHSIMDHHHEAPHGGSVIRLGDELFHLEWVKDTEAGLMRCYVMDGHLERFIRIAQESIEVLVDQHDGAPITWIFKAVENRATGEQIGDSSEFQAPLSVLPNQNTFAGTIREVHIQSNRFEDISFRFPEGNETH